ncbi:MAG: hypothetical protein JXR21_02555 [Candidatus Marinimicrobia bacterium]|nr:hypothetical protein [Candidatus Neomarinimicrobiota bacterium]
MIRIITGNINSGKTAYLRRLYAASQKGDGILSVKYFVDGVFAGYDLLHLKSGEQRPFIRLKDEIPEGWTEIFTTGKYSFSEEGFRFAETLLQNTTEAPVYIDEIGPLEIERKEGFYHLLKTFADTGRDLILSVRESMLDEMIRMFFYDKEIEIITP